MNELMQKITEKLNIAIDKAPDVYEMLKHQYIIYDVCNVILWILVLLFILSFGITLILMIDYSDYYGEKRTSRKRMIIGLAISTLLLLIMIVCVYTYRNVNAPDVLFLKEGLLGG
ncbi:hypothetical protein O3794_02720 [Gemella sanguinis]|uniref:hypothetical protein n=1 Tax=Gemella sanguinis TaxID=84135 RepID=UPI00352D1AB8